MDDLKRKRIRRLAYLIAAAVFAGVVFFLLRGPYVSNALKRIIQPELEMAMGRKVIAQQIYLNLFPLFAEAKDIKVFEDNGGKILVVKRAKAYIDLSGLLNRKVVIRRLVVKEPEVTTDRKQAEEIIEHVKSYLAKVRDTALKVKILVVEVQKGSVRLNDMENKAVSEMQGLDGEAILGKNARVRASAKKIGIKKEGWPDIEGDIAADISLKDGALLVKNLAVESFGSRIAGSGEYSDNGGRFEYGVKLLLTTVKRMFHLERSGEGRLNAAGTVNYRNHEISIDMKIEGNFFMQTLMELLKVKEKLEGLVGVKGEIKGPLQNLKGYGTMSLRKGNLFDVEVESLKCNVSYGDGKMEFTGGSGSLYNGRAKVSASINLPVVNFYTLDVNFEDVDSLSAFKLIGWDPGIAPGKVTGSLKSSGAHFNPEGRFEYKSIREGKDILGRIKNIAGGYKMLGPVISFTDLRLGTPKSDISARGTADTDKKTMDMDVLMKTKDLLDLTVPYYNKLKGSGEFSGSVKGAFKDPLITGGLKIYNPFFEGYKAEIMKADVSYRKDALEIKDMSAEGGRGVARLKGNVFFKNARELFDLARPEYRLNASQLSR